MKKILITVGYKKREYGYLRLLKKFVSKKGFDVRIRYMNFECYHEVFSWKPDFVMLSQVNQSENIEFAKYAKRTGAIVLVLNAELLFTDSSIRLKYDRDCNNYVDFTIEWGSMNKLDLLTRVSHLNREKIKILGAPKFDLYMRSEENTHQDLLPYTGRLNKSKKTVCFCTSFDYWNASWEWVKDNVGYKEGGKKAFDFLVQTNKQMARDYVVTAKQLARTNKYNIIFRNHPLEDPEFYLSELKNVKNIIFDNKVSQKSLFRVVDLIVHRSSTIAVEAWIYNIRTVTFDPINDSRSELFSFTRLERIFHSRGPLLDYIHRSLHLKRKPYNFMSHKKYLMEEFGFVRNGKSTSSERIANFLETVPLKKKQFAIHLYVMYFYILSIAKLVLFRKYIYEVIGLFKGKTYLTIMRDNYI